jgi:hypothetical protein
MLTAVPHVDGHSDYNNNQGVKYHIQVFLPVCLSWKGGQKPVEAPSGTQTHFIHKTADLAEIFRLCLSLHDKEEWMEDFP